MPRLAKREDPHSVITRLNYAAVSAGFEGGVEGVAAGAATEGGEEVTAVPEDGLAAEATNVATAYSTSTAMVPAPCLAARYQDKQVALAAQTKWVELGNEPDPRASARLCSNTRTPPAFSV